MCFLISQRDLVALIGETGLRAGRPCLGLLHVPGVQHGALTQGAHWQGGRKINESFPGGTVVKNLSDNATDKRDVCLIPGLGRSPAEGNSNPIFSPGKFCGWGVWWTAAHGVAKCQTQLND